jgi:hypothetical protein
MEKSGVIEMERPEIQRIPGIVLKAVAVGMSVTSMVMAFIPDVVGADIRITMLSVGLAALAIAALGKEE